MTCRLFFIITLFIFKTGMEFRFDFVTPLVYFPIGQTLVLLADSEAMANDLLLPLYLKKVMQQRFSYSTSYKSNR